MANHIHRYIRAIGRITEDNKDSGFIGYYKCADPACSHYMKAELVLGKNSICNRCGQEFVLPNALRMLTNRPHCKNCTKKKRKNPSTNIVDTMKRLEREEDTDEMQDWIDLADEMEKDV